MVVSQYIENPLCVDGKYHLTCYVGEKLKKKKNRVQFRLLLMGFVHRLLPSDLTHECLWVCGVCVVRISKYKHKP